MSALNYSFAPRLSVVSNELPDPPYPADTKANGWNPTIEIDRLMSSDTWVLADDEERPWLLRIWIEAWRSVPVGTMPADRRLFARRIGCKAPFVEAHAEILMRGWALYSDGNLYHAFILSQINSMLLARSKNREKLNQWRKQKAEEKKRNQLQGDCNQLQGGSYQVSNHHGQDRTGQDRTGQEEEVSSSLSTSSEPEPATADAAAGEREKDQTPPPAKTKPAKAVPIAWPGFDDFWSMYPKKVAKQDAQRAWNKLKLSDEDVGAIYGDVPQRLANDRAWVDGFIPNPATYLNGRRWEDAITPVQAARPSGRVSSIADRNKEVLDRFVNGTTDQGAFIDGECRHV